MIRKASKIIGSELSGEQFVDEHTFYFMLSGDTTFYDGLQTHNIKTGDYGVIRKNRLTRYSKAKQLNKSEKVFVIFDEDFLRYYKNKHQPQIVTTAIESTFLPIQENTLIPAFVRSLLPYFKTDGSLQENFTAIKQEELLLILLQAQPELAGILFDFGAPQKIDLEEFMLQNYKFNVSLDRFAFLTGRSLSAFKRDFKAIYNTTPGRWLVEKRLKEAYFLIDKKHKKPTDIYLDLGFETLSHFSYAFKKQYGKAPTAIHN